VLSTLRRASPDLIRIAPENATGNFTKIVQRVPVRIAVADGDGTLGVLRPGLSTTVSVDTRSAAEDGR
jgi:membrane fusion protein (multidrug efflux system)